MFTCSNNSTIILTTTLRIKINNANIAKHILNLIPFILNSVNFNNPLNFRNKIPLLLKFRDYLDKQKKLTVANYSL